MRKLTRLLFIFIMTLTLVGCELGSEDEKTNEHTKEEVIPNLPEVPKPEIKALKTFEEYLASITNLETEINKILPKEKLLLKNLSEIRIPDGILKEDLKGFKKEYHLNSYEDNIYTRDLEKEITYKLNLAELERYLNNQILSRYHNFSSLLREIINNYNSSYYDNLMKVFKFQIEDFTKEGSIYTLNKDALVRMLKILSDNFTEMDFEKMIEVFSVKINWEEKEFRSLDFNFKFKDIFNRGLQELHLKLDNKFKNGLFESTKLNLQVRTYTPKEVRFAAKMNYYFLDLDYSPLGLKSNFRSTYKEFEGMYNDFNTDFKKVNGNVTRNLNLDLNLKTFKMDYNQLNGSKEINKITFNANHQGLLVNNFILKINNLKGLKTYTYKSGKEVKVPEFDHAEVKNVIEILDNYLHQSKPEDDIDFKIYLQDVEFLKDLMVIAKNFKGDENLILRYGTDGEIYLEGKYLSDGILSSDELRKDFAYGFGKVSNNIIKTEVSPKTNQLLKVIFIFEKTGYETIIYEAKYISDKIPNFLINDEVRKMFESDCSSCEYLFNKYLDEKASLKIKEDFDMRYDTLDNVFFLNNEPTEALILNLINLRLMVSNLEFKVSPLNKRLLSLSLVLKNEYGKTEPYVIYETFDEEDYKPTIEDKFLENQALIRELQTILVNMVEDYEQGYIENPNLRIKREYGGQIKFTGSIVEFGKISSEALKSLNVGFENYEKEFKVTCDYNGIIEKMTYDGICFYQYEDDETAVNKPIRELKEMLEKLMVKNETSMPNEELNIGHDDLGNIYFIGNLVQDGYVSLGKLAMVYDEFKDYPYDLLINLFDNGGLALQVQSIYFLNPVQRGLSNLTEVFSFTEFQGEPDIKIPGYEIPNDLLKEESYLVGDVILENATKPNSIFFTDKYYRTYLKDEYKDLLLTSEKLKELIFELQKFKGNIKIVISKETLMLRKIWYQNDELDPGVLVIIYEAYGNDSLPYL